MTWLDEHGLNIWDIDKVVMYNWGYLLLMSYEAITRTGGLCAIMLVDHIDFREVHPSPFPIHFRGIVTKDIGVCVCNLQRVYILSNHTLYHARLESGDNRLVLGRSTDRQITGSPACEFLGTPEQLALFCPSTGLHFTKPF
ncbi:hypothetical protein GNI_083230 [Gregarina niphandrodes]|uniref:Uncharacterized protein n=1 Tax=Gregarina niphandrodes TaxID=110365 RepID=A0A023B660_GRENI|nr:hypothetical protein GNI_083230 [Gregarina niphandrodes]EZG65525.1 hypothetical protein GNI_083230 [Gregarina niphandrodes]|eukprot:XP_011134081.1 hypothetical protein GNI_083230 [Gregarina niphandrodes]